MCSCPWWQLGDQETPVLISQVWDKAAEVHMLAATSPFAP